MRYYITADHHFGHENIIKYCRRPFNSLAHMNHELMRRWNEKVNKEDIVIYNGDFCFHLPKEVTSQFGITSSSQYWTQLLNGKILFIKGNHGPKTPIVNMQLWFDNRQIFVVHDPKDFNPNIQYNLVGHIHNNWKVRKIWTGIWWCYLLNIGIDQWKFYPMELKEMVDYLTMRVRQKNIETLGGGE